jgi:phage replication initiation protein
MDKLTPQSDAFIQTALGSDGRTHAQAAPVHSNECGTAIARQEVAEVAKGDTPRLVIRGESLWQEVTGDDGESYIAVFDNKRPRLIHLPKPKLDTAPYSAITDYLNCTFLFTHPGEGEFFFDLLQCLGPNFGPISDRKKGLHGWDSSYKLGDSSAMFGIGGQNCTGFLSFPSEACHMIPNWNRLVTFLRDDLGARITRWDGAVDDYAGVHSVDMAVEMYLADQFTAGGNRPSCEQKGNWIQPDGRGRTFYVGKRENGKMIRIYEKGMQLGAKLHPWVRWEVELHNTDRIIPWAVLSEPGQFVAGSYPKALGWIHEDMKRIKTVQRTAEINYESLIKAAKLTYGKLFNVMLEVEGSADKVLEKLVRDGIPSRLHLPIVPEGEGRS